MFTIISMVSSHFHDVLYHEQKQGACHDVLIRTIGKKSMQFWTVLSCHGCFKHI